MKAAFEQPEEQIETGDGTETLYQRMRFVVEAGTTNLIRIDKWVQAKIEGASRNKVQQAIDAGLVLVNGKSVKTNYKIKPLDEIIFYSDEEEEVSEILPENIPLTVVYEDDDILLINKKPGMVVHPGCGNYTGTLLNAVAYYYQERKTKTADNLPRLGLVHRIDKNTSGLIVMAKTEKALKDLAKQFFDHTTKRQYVALVWGNVEQEEGTIVAHIGRHQRFRKLFAAYPDGEIGKDATTHYKVLERFGYTTLVQCELETGRTHQIRVHMKHIGHVLFADDMYGGDRAVKGTKYTKYLQFVENCLKVCPRQALHARTLGFTHPSTKEELFFECPLPEDMEGVLDKWRTYSKALNIQLD